MIEKNHLVTGSAPNDFGNRSSVDCNSHIRIQRHFQNVSNRQPNDFAMSNAHDLLDAGKLRAQLVDALNNPLLRFFHRLAVWKANPGGGGQKALPQTTLLQLFPFPLKISEIDFP